MHKCTEWKKSEQIFYQLFLVIIQLFISSPRLIYKHNYFYSMIHLENINKTYYNGAPLHVLKGITLDIHKGEFVSIITPYAQLREWQVRMRRNQRLCRCICLD